MNWLKSAGIRAWHAFWETAVVLIPVGLSVTEVDWLNVIELALAAAILSLAKSFAMGTECGKALKSEEELQRQIDEELTPIEKANELPEEKELINDGGEE